MPFCSSKVLREMFRTYWFEVDLIVACNNIWNWLVGREGSSNFYHLNAIVEDAM